MDGEFYEKEGLRYERITRILDYFTPPSLVSWKLKVGSKEAKRIGNVAKKIGSEVDLAIKADVQRLKIPKFKSKEAENCWEAYQQWKKDYGLALYIPDTVFDEVNRVAGTPDLAPYMEVLDIKCSSEIRPSYWLQTEFYGRNLTQFGKIEYKSILRLDKNLAMYEYKKMALNDEHWEAVRSAITLYRYYENPSKDGKRE